MGESGGRVQRQQPAAEPQRPSDLGRPAPEIATTAAQGHGAPLQPDVRREFEHRLGHNFGAVRVHSGNEAERATAALDASGFTLGRNVVLGGGVSDQASPVGRRILAHELRHVVQQAGFLDRELGGAPVLDASHPSEHEARAETGPLTPLAAPAVQLGPPDIVIAGQHVVIDLNTPDWADAVRAVTDDKKDVLYVLRETGTDIVAREAETGGVEVVEETITNVFRKVGKTELGSQLLNRMGSYRGTALELGKELYADVFTFDAGSDTAETVEAEARAGMEEIGAKLRWDNTGGRLERGGQGIPKATDASSELLDEGEQVRFKPAPQNIPKRRGDANASARAKRKAAAKQAAGEAAPEAEEAEQKAVQQTKKPRAPKKPRAAKPKPSPEPEPKAPETQAEAPSAVEEKPPSPAGQTSEAAGDAAEQAAKNAAGTTETVVAGATDEASALAAKGGAELAAEAAAGTLTAGIASTALEVLSNPALGFGYMFLEGLSGDYHAAWDAIRAPARVRGFAQGMAARFAGLDGHAALMMITPDFVDKANIGADVVGGEGMAEKAIVDGAREGWKYANGYSPERSKRELDRAAARLVARGGPELEYDVDGQIMRESLRNVAEMFLPQAQNAIARWDALRAKREAKEKADRLREVAKYDLINGGMLRAMANSIDPESE
jgi:hypothetical protein